MVLLETFELLLSLDEFVERLCDSTAVPVETHPSEFILERVAALDNLALLLAIPRSDIQDVLSDLLIDIHHDLEVPVTQLAVVVGHWGQVDQSDSQDVLVGVGLEHLVDQRQQVLLVLPFLSLQHF